MGKTDEGPSGAARGAPQAGGRERSGGGFLSRVIGALSPSDTGEEEAEPPPGGKGAGAQPIVPGLGNLRRLRVEDVMVPSAEITSAPLDISREGLVALFRKSGLTRLPVYDGTLDTPVGLVHLKDFALTHGFDCRDGRHAPFDLKALLRPLLYAPPSMPIGVLLQKMQAERIHMALVIDEYGGVDGLVTLEDLVEQVVGEIEDEHDADEGPFWIEEAPDCYLAEARAPLDDFEAAIRMRLRGVAPEDDEIDTLGGLVFLLSGRVPVRGEVIGHPSGAEFEVVDADPRRIKRLRIRLPERIGGAERPGASGG